jgi:hypothetical protein
MANRATAKNNRNDFDMRASPQDADYRAPFELSGILPGIIGRMDGKGYAVVHSEAMLVHSTAAATCSSGLVLAEEKSKADENNGRIG